MAGDHKMLWFRGLGRFHQRRPSIHTRASVVHVRGAAVHVGSGGCPRPVAGSSTTASTVARIEHPFWFVCDRRAGAPPARSPHAARRVGKRRAGPSSRPLAPPDSSDTNPGGTGSDGGARGGRSGRPVPPGLVGGDGEGHSGRPVPPGLLAEDPRPATRDGGRTDCRRPQARAVHGPWHDPRPGSGYDAGSPVRVRWSDDVVGRTRGGRLVQPVSQRGHAHQSRRGHWTRRWRADCA